MFMTNSLTIFFFYITQCWKCEYQWTAIEVKTFTLPQGRDDRLEVAEVKVCRWNEETSFIGTHAHHAKKKSNAYSQRPAQDTPLTH